jgi:hypothetical protein
MIDLVKEASEEFQHGEPCPVLDRSEETLGPHKPRLVAPVTAAS